MIKCNYACTASDMWSFGVLLYMLLRLSKNCLLHFTQLLALSLFFIGLSNALPFLTLPTLSRPCMYLISKRRFLGHSPSFHSYSCLSGFFFTSKSFFLLQYLCCHRHYSYFLYLPCPRHCPANCSYFNVYTTLLLYLAFFFFITLLMFFPRYSCLRH